MERLRNSLYWLTGLDPALTWDQRLGRWASVGTLGSIVVATVVWVGTLIFSIPWWVGLLAGLVAWVVILNTFVALGRRSQPNTPRAASTTESEAGLVSEAATLEQFEYENQQLQQQLEKATSELSLPVNVAVERHIVNRDFRIHDLLKLAGTDSTIEGKEFENCTIIGPATITTAAPPRQPESGRGSVAQPDLWQAKTVYVEGAPDAVLHEVPSGGSTASGVIHLVGCSYKRVTFRGIGIVGNADELRWWGENATFSRESAAPQPFPPESSSASEVGTSTVEDATIKRPWIRDHELSEPRFEERSVSLPEFARKAGGPGQDEDEFVHPVPVHDATIEDLNAYYDAIDIADMAIIRERTFVKCDIYGPCVVVPIEGKVGGRVFVDCEWLDKTAALWPPSVNPQRLIGVVVLEDCVFRECRLTLVGVLQTERLEEGPEPTNQ